MGKLISEISGYLYSYILIIILCLGGLYFTLRTKFLQFRLLGHQIKLVGEKPKDKKGVSSFQALMVSTASRVGTGNIVGVCVAICMGGYGSVFWMWVIAIFGSASAFIESTLAQIFKRKGDNSSYGGPAYYIESAFGNRPLALIFSVFLILTYGFGFNMLASYNLQSTFSVYPFYDKSSSPLIIGLIVAVLVCYCLFGGGKRIIKCTSLIVPIMGVGYILLAVISICINVNILGEVFSRIFNDAFNFKAIFGGFGGSCIMYGIKRGLFSNEAGVGSAPNASASADVSHPVKQGLVQVLSVFLDTLLVCSATAFLCMTSGVAPSKEYEGATYILLCVQKTFGDFGPVFITISMVLFAFTTLLGNLYYVDMAVVHINKKNPSKISQYIIYLVLSLAIFVGAILNSSLLWDIADITMGLMTIINMPVIIILSKYAVRALKDYEKQRKMGKDPKFYSKDIGLEGKTEYWK